MAYDKPLPAVDQWSKPFWDAAKDHKLMVQRCDVSGRTWFPPGPVSPVTRDGKWSWVELSGRGRIASWVVFHQRYFAGFADELPYTVVQVDLDGGPSIISNLVDVGDREIAVGMPVKVVFADATDEISLPKFAPAEEA
jgi:hypothetical protein